MLNKSIVLILMIPAAPQPAAWSQRSNPASGKGDQGASLIQSLPEAGWTLPLPGEAVWKATINMPEAHILPWRNSWFGCLYLEQRCPQEKEGKKNTVSFHCLLSSPPAGLEELVTVCDQPPLPYK